MSPPHANTLSYLVPPRQPVSEQLAPPPDVETLVAQQTRSAWLLAVLIGCVLFSGAAALFTLFPSEHNIGRGMIFPMTSE